MIPLAGMLVVLAVALPISILILAMKTVELSNAVTNLTTAANGLSTSVDAAIAVLINSGQPSTPDSDIVPLISAIDAASQTMVNAKAKLDAALTPPTT